MAFKQLVDDILTWRNNTATKFTPNNSVSLSEFQYWRKQFTWDALQNQRYGQSFCNHFNIQDHRIFFERDWQTCDAIIQRDWLARS